MKHFLRAHLGTNCTQFSVHTTEDEDKSNVSTNCNDSLLSTYKTIKIIVYTFSF